jgi:hypothetical protein
MKPLDKLKILYSLALDARQPRIFSFHDCLPDVFSKYLELLISKRYRVLDLFEATERMRLEGKFKKEVVLTFDDGRRNCWTVIFPLLKKYKVKASFFIIPSRIKESEEYYPNLEDYWNGRVSWENLYVSHRRQPHLTWKELAAMQESGVVNIFSHSLRHEVVSVSSSVIDFQHPGVYEMPVYFDEWFKSGEASFELIWGAPIYDRVWAPLASNVYHPNQKIDAFMNEFVRQNGGFLFFKKKKWRKKLFDYLNQHKKNFASGHFKRIENKEEAGASLSESKKMIEERLGCACPFFSVPLYRDFAGMMPLAEEVGYEAVLAGSSATACENKRAFLFRKFPSFWIQFLTYF